MKMIDKAAVVSVIVNTPTKNQHTDILSALAFRTIEILNLIEKSPSIDAVTVVRCKDCTHLKEQITDTVGFCYVHEDYAMADDFCSYGERKGQGE